MKTLFIAFFVGVCCLLSACDVRTSNNQELIVINLAKEAYVDNIEQDKEAIVSKLDPAEIHKHLGVSYLEQGELDKAILEFKKAIQISPRFVEAHYLLADVYSLKGEGLLSRTFLEKAMALEGSYIIDTSVTEKRIPSPPQYIFLAPEFLQGPIKRMDAPQR